MARQTINIGTGINTGTGDTLRAAMDKSNDNFEELYNATFGTDSANVSINVSQISTEVTNGSITLTPNGTGQVVVQSDLIVQNIIKSNDSTVVTIDDGLDVKGTVVATSFTGDGSGLTGVASAGNITFSGSSISTSDSTQININENLNVDGNIIMGDSDQIQLGDSGDLKIFHNGSHSIVRETGTGNLFLQSDNNVILSKDTGTETMVKAIADGAVELYHDDVKKFNTGSHGVDIVDEAHIEGATPHLTLKRTNNANVPTLRFKGSGGTVGATIGFDGTGGTANELIFSTYDGSSLVERLRVSLTGAEVTGPLKVDSITSNDSSALSFDTPIHVNTISSVDSSAIQLNDSLQVAGNLTVGENDTNATITTQGSGDLTLSTNSGTNSGTIKITDGTNGDITIENDGTGDILLKAGGQVGIGSVSSPDTSLHIKTAAAKVTLQRTADANTPGISFQQSGGNVRAEFMMDGTSGTSNTLFFKTHDGSSLSERFRVTHTGAKVSGTLEVDEITGADSSAIQINNLDTNVISSSSSSEILINDSVGINGTLDVGGDLKVNTMSAPDSSEIRVSDSVSISSNLSVEGTVIATGNVRHKAATIYDVQDDLATSTTALSLNVTVHSLAGGESDYTLAAGSEGQIMHFVVAGGSSTANEVALTEITVSQVRNPRDGDVLATYVWRPFIAGTTELGDSTIPQRTMASCIFANGAWNLDFFTQA